MRDLALSRCERQDYTREASYSGVYSLDLMESCLKIIKSLVVTEGARADGGAIGGLPVG